MIEAGGSSENLVYVCQTTRGHMPELTVFINSYSCWRSTVLERMRLVDWSRARGAARDSNAFVFRTKHSKKSVQLRRPPKVILYILTLYLKVKKNCNRQRWCFIRIQIRIQPLRKKQLTNMLRTFIITENWGVGSSRNNFTVHILAF
jgi:hypothetical protein